MTDPNEEEIVVPGQDVPVFEALKREIYGDDEKKEE